MSTEMSGQRRQEVIAELLLASRYFERLSAEIDNNERHPLPGDEWQMAQHIHESILLLQWRLESFGHQKNQVETQHVIPSLALKKQPTEEQAITRHSYNQISHSNSE